MSKSFTNKEELIKEVKEGMENLSLPTQEEKDFLGEETCGERLACQCKIRQGKVTITF